MNRYKLLFAIIVFPAIILTSCISDLDTVPLNKRIVTSSSIFQDTASYKEFLAKLYGSLTLTGQRGEFGQPEISNPDEGETSFMRMYFYMQELSTDEVINAWGITEFYSHNWTAQDRFLALMYSRIYINIAYCNEFIRQASSRVDGLSPELGAEVKQYIAEAKFLRAWFYYCAIDLFGNVPFVTEADAPGAYLPAQIKRADLFAYIQTELTSILPELADAGTNEYARADKAAAWMLLAKLNLNAEVYLGNGNKHYDDVITYCNNIINSGAYSLHTSYPELFMADNDRLRNEIIFPVAEDGNNGRDYGSVTYIINAEVGGGQDNTFYGLSGTGWAGNRFSNAFVNKFADPTGATDKRALFFTTGQSIDINSPATFAGQGYKSTKFRNVTSTGAAGQNGTFVDTDFPLFRYADVLLMYAEAVKRGGQGGSDATALGYLNAIRERAYGNTTGDIDMSQFTLQYLLDERARELHWEVQRRTDLVRFGQFTGGDYVWDWKGGIKAGRSTDSHYDLYCLPVTDLAINTNLKQNIGY